MDGTDVTRRSTPTVSEYWNENWNLKPQGKRGEENRKRRETSFLLYVWDVKSEQREIIDKLVWKKKGNRFKKELKIAFALSSTYVA